MTGMKPFWAVSLTHMFVEVYYLTQVALIPTFIREFNLSLLETSLVATVPSFIQLLANLPSGYLSERLTTRQLLFASMVTEGLSAFLVSRADDFWVLVLGVSAMRLCSPIYHISGLSRISHIVGPEKVNRSMGFHNALGSFGSAIGLIVLSVFQSTIGWRWTYTFWAFPILAWGFLVLRTEELGTGVQDGGGNKMGLSNLTSVLSTAFMVFLIAIGFNCMGLTGIQTYMTTYLVEVRGLTDSMASLIFGLGPFIGIMGALNGGYMGEKMGPKKALGLVIICSAVSILFLMLLSPFYLLLIAYLAYMFFSSSVWSPMNSIVTNITPKIGRGFSYSVYFLTEGVVVSITPTIMAAAIGLSEIWFIFPFSMIFMVMGLIVLQIVSCPR